MNNLTPAQQEELRRLDEQIAQLDRLARIEDSRDSLLTFTEATMPDPQYPDDVLRTRYEAAMHHKAIAEALEEVERGRILRLLITMPPRHGKSELASRRFPAWFTGRDRYRQTIFATYNSEFAEDFGRNVRDIVNSDVYKLIFPGVAPKTDTRSAGRMEIQDGGMMIFTGVGGSIVGRGADLLLIDDPFKNSEEAESLRTREVRWNWFKTTAYTRLMPGGRIVIIMCMTGDTPVLMASGEEKPLRDIRPGDQVATYDEGRAATSTVLNWSNNGPDSVFRIKMTSGIIVRANARHPFLVSDAGEPKWVKVKDLRPGLEIFRVNGASGRGRAVPATVAPGLPRPWSQQRPTSDFTLDTIESIEPDGVEDVFDIQVERTENFIADGLVSKNTRWHEDDLIGRLLSTDYVPASEIKKWVHLDLPAIAYEGTERELALWPQRYPLEVLRETRNLLSPREWNALYQQRPTPPEGAFFKRASIERNLYMNDELPRSLTNYTSFDLAVGADKKNDSTCCGTVGLDADDVLWLLPDIYWERRPADQSVEFIAEHIMTHDPVTIFVEKGKLDKAVGPFLETYLRERKVYNYFERLPVNKNKGAKATSIRGRIEQGKVRFPKEAWWWPMAFDQMLKFTGSGDDKEDDFVDMISLLGQGLRLQTYNSKDETKPKDYAPTGTFGWVKQQSNLERRAAERQRRLAGW